ncbi:MAG TPA: hypothetical protein DIU00_03560 [Phycisphaerales bacterium]|nr:hypothetical protein [Phycisphaerales bacterium]
MQNLNRHRFLRLAAGNTATTELSIGRACRRRRCREETAESINLAKDEKYKKTLESLRKRCNELAQKAKGT